MALQLVAQLVPVPPGKVTGGFNCGPAAGATAVIHATAGQERPEAWEVRDLCREPNGKPDVTGGTHLRQVADAIDRGWGVEMSVVTPSQYAVFRDRMKREPTTVGSVSLWYGAFKGTPVYASRSGFTGNHQVVVRWIGTLGAEWEMVDPLADGNGRTSEGRPVPLGPVRVSDNLLRRAAGQLQVTPGNRLGSGRIFVGYVRGPAAPKPKRYSIAFGVGAFHVYSVQGGVAISRVSRTFTKATSAPCEAPRPIPILTSQGSRKALARITKGALAGQYVEPGRAHVRLVTR